MTFSRRDLFWYCAGIVSVLALGWLVHALNGSPGPAPQAAPVSADTAATDSPAHTPAPAAQAAGSMDEVLQRLQGRLATQGGADSDWELLAQTYEFVGRNEDARRARAHQLPDSARAAPATASAEQQAAAPSSSASAAITGSVELATALKSKIASGLTLFIIAKSVDAPGPPLAIERTTTASWPLSFRLDDSNAMLPGRNLSGAQHVTIEARVSRSGMATPASGDYQSSITPIDPRSAKPVKIVIDHVID